MKRILYLDDDESLCFLMSELFQESGAAEVVTLNSFSELKSFKEDIHGFEIIVLDINLGKNVPSGLDAFKWLKDQGYDKKIIFFTGHAESFPLVQNAVNNLKISLLEKPASLETISHYLNN